MAFKQGGGCPRLAMGGLSSVTIFPDARLLWKLLISYRSKSPLIIVRITQHNIGVNNKWHLCFKRNVYIELYLEASFLFKSLFNKS